MASKEAKKYAAKKFPLMPMAQKGYQAGWDDAMTQMAGEFKELCDQVIESAPHLEKDQIVTAFTETLMESFNVKR